MSVDEFSTTQPIMERLLIEMKEIGTNVKSIQRHLDEQDKRVSEVHSQTNLAGNIAARALETANETREIVRRIDQSLTGIYELAKSGFDIATAIKSASDTDRPPPYEEDPIIEIGHGTYRIVGTGN